LLLLHPRAAADLRRISIFLYPAAVAYPAAFIVRAGLFSGSTGVNP
jgi:hypothetical protein